MSSHLIETSAPICQISAGNSSHDLQAAFDIHKHCSDLSAHVSNGYEIWCYFMNMHDVSLLYSPRLLS